MSSEPATQPTPKPRAWWRRYFPVCWWAFLLMLAAMVRWAGGDQLESDEQTIMLILLANLAWIVPLAWLLFAWPPFKQLPWVRRWTVRLAVAAVIMLIYMNLDVQYDGDGKWVRVRLSWMSAPDEQLAVLAGDQVAADWQPTPNDYPRFLGNGYWAEVDNTALATDWQATPPELVWKHAIGAGWSAFAVVGDYAVTQEQRGDQEIVACYRVSDGEVVWTHADTTRHDPEGIQGGMGGVGPRATPTVYQGHVYTMGATGLVNCLDATNGNVVWSHDLADEYKIVPLLWGNSGSPLVVPDEQLVVVAAGIADTEQGHSLYAFDLMKGTLVWSGGPQGTSYASPVLATIAGVEQIVQVDESSVSGYRVTNGEQLWSFEQPGSSSGNASCSQAIPLPGDRVLASKGYGIGARLVQITSAGDGNYTTKVLWEKQVLKTKFSNLVLRDGYAYGLDHNILSCVDIETGKVEWKKRRSPSFGHGQLLLVGDTLFALSETGEGVLVACQPTKYQELASLQMLTDQGVTWNNPALAGPYLLVRNDLEAACYRLPLLPDNTAQASSR